MIVFGGLKKKMGMESEWELEYRNRWGRGKGNGIACIAEQCYTEEAMVVAIGSTVCADCLSPTSFDYFRNYSGVFFFFLNGLSTYYY